MGRCFLKGFRSCTTTGNHLNKYLFICLFLVSTGCYAANQCSTPLIPISSENYREDQNIYQCLTNPVISTGIAQNFTIVNATITGSFIAGKSSTNACGYIIGSVVQSSYPVSSGGQTSGTSATYTATGGSSAFTPKCASDIVIVTGMANYGNSNPSTTNTDMTIFRDSTDLGPSSTTGLCGFGDGGLATQVTVPCTMQVIDRPNTTSQVTYTMKIRNPNGAGTFITGKLPGNGGAPAGTLRMVILEIAG